MFLLSEERLLKFFREISLGFRVSTLEIVFFLLLIAGLCFFFIYVSRLIEKKHTSEQMNRFHRIFHSITSKRSLKGHEIALLDRLTAHLRNTEEKILLFQSSSLFNSCALAVIGEDGAAAIALSLLRNKLGFRHPAETRPFSSSAELPEGVLFRIFQEGGGEGLTGRLVRGDIVSMLIELGEGIELPPAGSRIFLLFENPSGLFAFGSVVRKSHGRLIHASHSKSVKRIQMRNFFRKSIL